MWAREKSVKAEKRDRNAEREEETFRRQRHHQSLTPKHLFLSLSLHFYLSSPPLHFFLALTLGQYILFENACELQRVVLHLEEYHLKTASKSRTTNIYCWTLASLYILERLTLLLFFFKPVLFSLFCRLPRMLLPVSSLVLNRIWLSFLLIAAGSVQGACPFFPLSHLFFICIDSSYLKQHRQSWEKAKDKQFEIMPSPPPLVATRSRCCSGCGVLDHWPF